VKLLIDMNLSPLWVAVFARRGWHAIHWSSVGDPKASDRTVMEYARSNDYVVFTHDLDFGTLLALAGSSGPSVIQIRAQDILPEHLERLIIAAFREHEAAIEAGALVVVDEERARVRLLPIRR
jgi:predicted nuclease of predicted toxin-antitoxin system